MYVPRVREEQMVRNVHACVALLMIVGAWSMAIMLCQFIDIQLHSSTNRME